MSSSGTACGFNTTVWSLVTHARTDRAALEQLLRTYWSPIYAAVRRRGFGPHDASDLTQEFMARVVLGRNLVSRSDPSRGRFRAFLKTSLHNFLIDHLRKRRSGRGGEATLADSALEASVAGGADVGLLAFDRAWAVALVREATERLREQCEFEGMQAHWKAFDACVLGPSVRRQNAPALDALARDLFPDGSVSASQVGNMLQTLKRRFQRILREQIATTVSGPEEVERELRDLRESLGR